MQYDLLASPIEYLKGVGPAKAVLLKEELGIFTFGDLLLHFPFRYEDRTTFYQVKDISQLTQTVQLRGVIEEMHESGEGRKRRLVAYFNDGTGVVQLIWFQGVSWVRNTLKTGCEYIVFGKPQVFKQTYSIAHPEISPLEEEEKTPAGKLQPVYSSTDKLRLRFLDSRGINRLLRQLLEQIQPADLPEILPPELLLKYKLISRNQAFREVHFPPGEAALLKATNRLKFEEFFLLQWEILRNKQYAKQQGAGFIFKNLGDFFHGFYQDHLPFELTGAQKRVVREIRNDLLSGKQMNRLLQGDVGSGKTVVALLAALMAADNGFQSCLMAPTEILAQQHYRTLKELAEGLGLRMELLTGNVKGKERKKMLEDLYQGHIHLLIGTHALIEDEVRFRNLGLAVIDEQHRFGVEQRARLWRKNTPAPHVLVMTATPIPRTLAMTLYGDLDVSVIDELPPGRKPVQTFHRSDAARLAVFGFMKKQIAEGRQIYVVYPLIEESEKSDLKNLMEGYDAIVRAFPMPEYQVSIVHGRMKNTDKEYEMKRFVDGITNIMVATTVIEVGVNVPNASVMVIESAERFGLSQLHQLRGRVGRGADQSYCILMSGDKLTREAKKRMHTMCTTQDGFEIAEVDLELRGPGDLAGTQQSGVLSLHIASLSKDRRILEAAREEALQLMERDFTLSQPAHQALRDFVNRKHGAGQQWGRIS